MADMASAQAGWEASQDATDVDGARSWYILILLTLSYALAYIDRQLLNLVVDPIRHTLGLTDTQLSFLQGAAFISAYILAAPLFGRLVDIANRRNILLVCVCIWSASTILCGLAGNFWELAAARFGVGLSEACVLPVAWSLIPEFFSMRRAPRALSIFQLGGQIGGGFSLLAGGAVLAFAGGMVAAFPLLSGLEPWQMSFVVVGIPGFLFAMLLFTIREPARRATLAHEDAEAVLSGRQTFATLWARRAFYGRVYFAIGFVGIVFLGIPSWFPTYLIRVHGMAAADVGYMIGLITLGFGTLGTLLGPWIAHKVEERGHVDAPLRVAAISVIAMLFACAAIPFAENAFQALVVLSLITFCCSFPTGVVAFATQLATPGRMRGTVASLYTVFAQVIGYGIGPTAVAMTTDHLFADPMKVGSSLQIVCCVASALAALMLFSCLAPYRRLVASGEDAA